MVSPGRADAADRVAEERVAGEDRRRAPVLDEERQHARACGRACAAGGSPARRRRRRSPVSTVPVAPDEVALERADQHLQRRPARDQAGDVADVVVVVVGQQHHLRRDREAIGGGEDRLERPAGVDHDSAAPASSQTR